MSEKEEKMSDQIQQKNNKLKNDNTNTFRELVKLVVLNSLINIFFKIPSCITSLNDFRLIVYKFNFSYFTYFSFLTNPFVFPYTMDNLCVITKACLVFQSFGHFLFQLSLSTNFFFLKRFDKNFRSAFTTIFGP